MNWTRCVWKYVVSFWICNFLSSWRDRYLSALLVLYLYIVLWYPLLHRRGLDDCIKCLERYLLDLPWVHFTSILLGLVTTIVANEIRRYAWFVSFHWLPPEILDKWTLMLLSRWTPMAYGISCSCVVAHSTVNVVPDRPPAQRWQYPPEINKHIACSCPAFSV